MKKTPQLKEELTEEKLEAKLKKKAITKLKNRYIAVARSQGLDHIRFVLEYLETHPNAMLPSEDVNYEDTVSACKMAIEYRIMEIKMAQDGTPGKRK
jgi:hypothetical protein